MKQPLLTKFKLDEYIIKGEAGKADISLLPSDSHQRPDRRKDPRNSNLKPPSK